MRRVKNSIPLPYITNYMHNFSMKFLSSLFILSFLMACDPYGFGFKRNPAFILDEAFKAVANLDVETFNEVTGKEALCVYGNTEGIKYLKKQVQTNVDQVELRPTLLEKEHYQIPRFVGYWSYYHERYEIEISDDKETGPILKTIVDCEYGVEGEKKDKYINLKPLKYKMKACRLIKIKPIKFDSLPVSRKCETIRVNS